MTPVTVSEHRAWRDAIAAQLKAERALRGLDQETVCERTGISRSTYSRIERGMGANLDQLVAIADAFDVPLPDLLGRAQAEMERRAASPVAPQQRRARAGKVRTQAPSKPKVTVRQSD